MKLTIVDVWTRLRIKLSRSIYAGDYTEIMAFGDDNNYPQITERIVNNSVTATSAARILKAFIIGKGYNKNINNVIIGKDLRGKNVTVLELMKLLAEDLAIHNGCYLHIAQNLIGDIKSLAYVPFKNCRFGKLDDLGYTSIIYVYDKWEKGYKFERNNVRKFYIYSSNNDVFINRVNEAGGIENFNGQIDFYFDDNKYIYPLSRIDSVFHDVDAEFGIGLYRDNIFRNGVLDKVIITVKPQQSDTERLELKNKIMNLISADGDPVLLLEEEELDPNGQLPQSIKIDKIPTNINSEIFEKLEPLIVKRIRKAFLAIPAVLIDYEESKLGTTSGEAIIQAVNYYNAITSELRNNFGNWLAEHLKKFDNEQLRQNNDWTIKPLEL